MKRSGTSILAPTTAMWAEAIRGCVLAPQSGLDQDASGTSLVQAATSS